MNLEEWEARYRARADSHQPAPLPLLIETAQHLRPGRALDLACGSGRHALWLAERGWNVTAVDGSPTAVVMLTTEAARLGLAIDARIANLEDGGFAIEPSGYDLILSLYYFQRDLMEPIKEGLAPGGVAVVVALTAKSRFRAQPDELRNYFRDWQILHSREGPDAAGHEVSEISARKPGP